MPQDPSLAPRPSKQQAAWEKALNGGDSALLEHLALNDDPAAALLVLESYINGMYRGSLLPLSMPKAEIESKVARALPFVDQIRTRLGWRVRDFDLGLLRLMRQSSALSAVLGAGVSMGAGAPSWPDLVRLMLEETLDKGLALYEPVPAADNPAEPPIEFLPDGTVRMGGTGTWRFEQRVGAVKRYTQEQEQIARGIVTEIKAKGSKTDVETLMRGAQVCYDLCGQELFRLLTGILYARAKEPSKTHRAIAELAHAQEVPGRGADPLPGWDSIITYNIDALMSEALTEQKIPHAAWAMKGDSLGGDPDELARESPWHQAVFHLHGYTPRRLFLITNVRFVFSTSQYLTIYKGPRSEILETVFCRFLANPVHVALYIGCSFADEAMNGLLRDAFAAYPGRYHYALLQWPRDRNGQEPAASEIKTESAKYLEFGVRPVWYDDHEELPGLVRQLQ
ncbi:MAG TPA: SIR2 family protein [Burkholderiales bacterium]|nr:SIR2 family protein [Burkholderiales bacterium]